MMSESLKRQLEEAIKLATKAHKGQSRKGSGLPYITHPLSVASIAKEMVKEYFLDDHETWGLKVQIVAVLHDTVEDTPITFEDLSELFDEDIVEAVRSVTETEPHEIYFNKVDRAKKNAMGRIVKMSDITHNMSDLDRNKRRDKYDKYHMALEYLKI